MRINKYLASCNVASRRGAEAIIQAGRVTVNGELVTDLAVTVDEHSDIVRLDGRRLSLQRKKVYVLLNKPKGFITTVKDERGRKSILDIVKVRERIYPVGRLDRNSEGLLLLTNDGEMTHRLLHPGYKVSKTYRARLDRPFEEKHFETLVTGVPLDDGVTAPCRARFGPGDGDRIEIQIREGRKRQVRRMFEALGYDVKTLKRVQFGPLKLGELRRGEWRLLSRYEVAQLRKAVGLQRKPETRGQQELTKRQ